MITLPEVQQLSKWVQSGGQLIWHGLGMTSWCYTFNNMIGAMPVDILATWNIEAQVFNATYTFFSFQSGLRIHYQQTSATVIAYDTQGLPMVMRNTYGNGQIVSVVPTVEDTIITVATNIPARDGYTSWYAGVLSLLGEYNLY